MFQQISITINKTNHAIQREVDCKPTDKTKASHQKMPHHNPASDTTQKAKSKDLAGIEPATIRSAVERSTTELQIQTIISLKSKEND